MSRATSKALLSRRMMQHVGKNLLLAVPLLCSCFVPPVSSVVLLTPPMQHYGYYDAVRSDLFDFYAEFHSAAQSVGERAVLVTNQSPRIGIDDGSWYELVERGVPESDLIVGLLDDIWVRDYFTTQLTDENVARFKFAPAYLGKTEVSYIESSAERTLQLWDLPGLTRYDDLVLDGGGIVFNSGLAVVTERVLRDNPRLVGRNIEGIGPAENCCPADPYGILDGDAYGMFTTEELQAGEAALAKELGFDAVAIVPEEPGVPRLGHVDGIANWLAPGVLALSAFEDADAYASYEAMIVESLGSHNVTVVPFPYAPTVDAWQDGFESAKGIYVNFLRTEKAIYVPTFGLPEDEEALQVAEKHGDRPVVGVNATTVSVMGGSVRCLSQHLWGDPADVVLARAEKSSTSNASPSGVAPSAVAIGVSMLAVTITTAAK